jgi:polysaccharide chain length determinant protein (PEP-CTERM system associated)
MIIFNDQVKIWLDIVWRRKWLLILPLIASLIAGYFMLQRLPRRYRASTLILVIAQKVPESFVRSTVTTGVEERMASLSVQILSRSFLESVVKKTGMIAEGAPDLEIERACNRLRPQVKVTYDKRKLSYFRIEVTDAQARRAAEIANLLADLFIEQNNSQRQEEATRTLEQVERWLKEKSREIAAFEKQLSEYRGRYLMELPQQLGTNMSLLNASTQQVETLSQEIQNRTQRLDLLRDQAQAASTSTGLEPLLVETGAGDDPVVRMYLTLRSELATLLLDYTEQHPDVRRKRDQIAELRRLHPELDATPQPVETTGDSGTAVAEVRPLTGPALEIAELQIEIADLVAQREAEREKIALYTARIERAPKREQELADLSRDADVLRRDYDALRGMKSRAEQGRDLEVTQRGEQFRVQDAARPPGRPFSPKAFNVFGMFLAGGLGAGVALMLVFEVFDQSVKTEVEFRQMYPDIPLLETMPHFDQVGAPSRWRLLTRMRKQGR